MSTPKRERSINFSREEVEILTSLVAQHKNVLENKKSDAVTWQEKEQCWKTLEALFNSISGVNFRTAKTLKAKYEGIKRATRKKSAAIRAETYRTGGGPSAAPPLTPVEEKIKDMILLSVDGIESQFDSDNFDSTKIILSSEHPVIIEPENIPSVEVIDSQEEPISLEAHTYVEHPKRHLNNQPIQKEDGNDEHSPKIISENATPKKSNDERWANWKPKSLRSKKHPALSATKMKRPFEKVADMKMELVDVQKKILEEELIHKRKQWAFEEEERNHKREIWDLEKKYWLNKLQN